MNRPALLLVFPWTLGVLGCMRAQSAGTAAPAVEFGTGQVQIVSSVDTMVLQVEIAETPQQHRVGLKRRPELPPDAGMIFLFTREQGRGSSFWMYRTYVPLSIAFLDAEGSIRRIREMEPCSSRFSLLCPSYAAGVPYHAALEVNRGYFARHGIGVGARVILQRGSRQVTDPPSAFRRRLTPDSG